MASLFDLLENVRTRPGMYVAFDDERTGALEKLETMIHGYEAALQMHGIKEPGENFSRHFTAYLWETREWSGAQGFARAVRDATTTDRDAWDLFWTLLDEYEGRLARKDRSSS